MEKDLFENVGPPSHKIVKDYHGIEYLLQLVTHEIRPGPDQKMVIVMDGATSYDAIQILLKELEAFLADPVKKRFFVPAARHMGIHIYIVEEVDAELVEKDGSSLTFGEALATKSVDGISYTDGYCLVKMVKTRFSWPTDVMGSLFTCPFCGSIDEVASDSRHVFNPSYLLVAALEKGKS